MCFDPIGKEDCHYRDFVGGESCYQGELCYDPSEMFFTGTCAMYEVLNQPKLTVFVNYVTRNGKQGTELETEMVQLYSNLVVIGNEKRYIPTVLVSRSVPNFAFLVTEFVNKE